MCNLEHTTNQSCILSQSHIHLTFSHEGALYDSEDTSQGRVGKVTSGSTVLALL